MVARILLEIDLVASQPNSISELAESVADVSLDAVAKEVPPPPRHTHKLGRCETAETVAITIA